MKQQYSLLNYLKFFKSNLGMEYQLRRLLRQLRNQQIMQIQKRMGQSLWAKDTSHAAILAQQLNEKVFKRY
ncbi:unnamed protein product [Paramecium octaurelia]|uniref:Uncharacterized protein n=1 Tax=Paramecium octaurelia TaxID=43137 RepID=A0A8S1UIR6_PAROT|nr:unnamed protein product [Paramecium octaurelia]